MNLKRKKIAKKYFDKIQTSEKMQFNKGCSYHLYWVLVKNKKKFMKELLAKGIETGSHYLPVHHMSYYKSKINLPITEQIGSKIVTLPMHPNLSEKEIDFIIEKINENLWDSNGE